MSFTGVGTCVIDFNDPGSTNWSTASTSQSISVSALVTSPVTVNAIVTTSTTPGQVDVGSSGYRPTARSTFGYAVQVRVDPRSSNVCQMTANGLVRFIGAGTCLLDYTTDGANEVQQAIRVNAFKVVREVGSAIQGRLTTIRIVGEGFYGRPHVTSNLAGVRAQVVRDNGRILFVRISTPRSARDGVHELKIVLGDGATAVVRYDQRSH